MTKNIPNITGSLSALSDHRHQFYSLDSCDITVLSVRHVRFDSFPGKCLSLIFTYLCLAFTVLQRSTPFHVKFGADATEAAKPCCGPGYLVDMVEAQKTPP